MEPDFSGWATKAGLKCSDGRTIMPNAFQHQDKARVPLVWQHGHTDPENVLGHAILENRSDGVYAYGYFNDSPKAEHTKRLISHNDINMLSIWANQLIERSGKVLHGAIREVSLVLSGANPGALIENVAIRHSDSDEDDILEDEAIIYTGLQLEHSDISEDEEEQDEEQDDEEEAPDVAKTEAVSHATITDNGSDSGDSEETVQDIYNSMSQKQKDVLHYMVGAAIESASGTLAQDALDDDKEDSEEGTDTMAHTNVFEQDEKPAQHVLSHDAMAGIMADARRSGSLKDAVEAYASDHLEHGIEDIDTLFPDAKNISNVPEFLARRMEWVSVVLGGVRKSPFSRIKTLWADLTFEEARAKGYVKGNMKKEEFFKVAKRVTTPTTIYKKQKLDRDDLVDITDFDVVVWLKGEMRIMLDEEIARAILVGDGREADSDDKIDEDKLRPIATDDEVYVTTINVNIDDASSSVQEVVDALVLNRKELRGTGLPVMFTTETYVARFTLLKDTTGRDLYPSMDAIATKLRVSQIVPVEILEEYPDIVAILVNPTDYVLGADSGGQVSLFDDFDIDYNQYKYLIETRVSGALVKLKCAMVVRKTGASTVLITPTEPTFNSSTGVITIPSQTGVDYKDGATTLVAGAQAPLASGASKTVTAVAKSGYAFNTSEDDTWTYTRD